MTTAASGERSQEPVGDDVGAAVSARGRDWEEVPGRVSMAELWAQVAQRVGGETEGREEEEEEARNATMEAVQRAVLRSAGFRWCVTFSHRASSTEIPASRTRTVL